MVKRRAWVQREFVFDVPAWMYPNIIERLRGTPARCESITRGLGRDALTRRDGDAWSIQEHVGHLLDLEVLIDGRLDDFEAGREELRAADMTNARTREAHHNEAELADILDDLAASRARIVARFERLPDDAVTRPARHPRLNQPMRPIDLALFFAEHDDHHLATITALKRRFEIE